MNRLYKTQPSSYGFTLIELMIAVVVLSVILTLAIPRFLGSIAKQELRTHTYTLQNDLTDLRNEAIAVGRMPNKTVTVSNTANIAMMVSSSLTSVPNVIAFNRFGVPGKLTSASGIQIHTPISAPITYTFSVQDKTDRSYKLELATTGKVKVSQIN